MLFFYGFFGSRTVFFAAFALNAGDFVLSNHDFAYQINSFF